MRLVLTCEHASHEVPAHLRSYFESPAARSQLLSHRGFDPGALKAAKHLADALQAPLLWNPVSRLVVETNRSLSARDLFSDFIPQDRQLRESILELYYHPYRESVTSLIARQIQAEGPVVHVSVHSFTPRLRREHRRFEFGVLFDPARELERRWGYLACERLMKSGYDAWPNRPYAGTDDGFTTHLRQLFAADHYLGIELEINNRFHVLDRGEQAGWCLVLQDAILQAAQEIQAADM